MFDGEALTRIVSLQEKSYSLVKWVNEALRQQKLDFTVAHEAMSYSEAAKEWIGRHLRSIPMISRPEAIDLDAFAHLFSSYLLTSFELTESPKPRIRSRGRCYCSWCSMLVAGDHLKPRQPSRKAKNVAQELKRIYVSNLASELGIQNGVVAVDLVLSAPTMEKPVALATYGAELIRRSSFASQGEGVLVLWREFAWDEGRLKKGFQLSAERILAAEREICDFLRTAP